MTNRWSKATWKPQNSQNRKTNLKNIFFDNTTLLNKSWHMCVIHMNESNATFPNGSCVAHMNESFVICMNKSYVTHTNESRDTCDSCDILTPYIQSYVTRMHESFHKCDMWHEGQEITCVTYLNTLAEAIKWYIGVIGWCIHTDTHTNTHTHWRSDTDTHENTHEHAHAHTYLTARMYIHTHACAERERERERHTHEHTHTHTHRCERLMHTCDLCVVVSHRFICVAAAIRCCMWISHVNVLHVNQSWHPCDILTP